MAPAVAVAVTSPNPLPMESTAIPPDPASAPLVGVVEVAVVAVMAVMVGITGAAMREEVVVGQMTVPARRRRNWIRRWMTTGVETTPRLRLLRSNPRLLPHSLRLLRPQWLLLLRLLPQMTTLT